MLTIRNLCVTHMEKNLLAMQETSVQYQGWEDPLEKGMATHSSILAWRNPWTEKPGGLQSMGSQRVRHDWLTKHTLINIMMTMIKKKKTVTFPTGNINCYDSLKSCS